MTAFTLLNTRPQHQAQALSDLVASVGGSTIACPTMSIVPQALPAQHSEVSAFDKLVFASVNAVNAFVDQGFHLPHNQTDLNCFAIGKATLLAAQQAGLLVNPMLNEQFDSESLLAHPDLQQLKSQRVLLLKGDKGRGLLTSTFEARGASVEEWELYRCQPSPLCLEAWQKFKQAPNPIILASSAVSLENLIKAIENEQACTDDVNWLFQQRLVSYSQRIKEWAQKQGWQGEIVVVATQSDQGTLDCIIDSHWDK